MCCERGDTEIDTARTGGGKDVQNSKQGDSFLFTCEKEEEKSENLFWAM